MIERVDILGCGCAAVDDLLLVDAYPAIDQRVPVRRWERQCGGLTATALVAAARQGARCRYVGQLGTEELSDFVLAALQREGIDIAHVPRRDGVRPVHSMIVAAEASRTRNIFYHREPAMAMSPDFPLRELVRAARVLFVDDVDTEASLRAVRLAREAGIPVVADCENGVSPGCAELVEQIGHLILSLDVARTLAGDLPPPDLPARLWSAGRDVVVVTDGARGCWYLAGTPGGRVCHQPAFPVQVVDTTGCGDVFHGAYAAALAQGAAVAERVRFASAVAALKATHQGGQRGIPTREAVDQFLKSKPCDREEIQ